MSETANQNMKEETQTTEEESPKLTPEEQAALFNVMKRQYDVGGEGKKPIKYSKRGIKVGYGIPVGEPFQDLRGVTYVKMKDGSIRKVA
jgi:hypothetical protein